MNAITVSQFNQYMLNSFESNMTFSRISIRGEISDFKRKNSNYFFVLNENECKLSCSIWANYAKNVNISMMSDGTDIIATGSIKYYKKNGTYSLHVSRVDFVGAGLKMLELKKLKEKLTKEGIFDSKYKKELMEYPERIGVVTSGTGAAIEDILRTVKIKNTFTDIIKFPCHVQGKTAPDEIVNCIKTANKLNEEGYIIDTLIVCRGGGSTDDLSAFNEEKVVRAIFASDIPVISAVGHEIDITLSDFVADKRASTPTQAAEMAVQDTYLLNDKINKISNDMTREIKFKVENLSEQLNSYTNIINNNIQSKIANAKSEIEKAMILIKENDPNNIFSKGYSAVMNMENCIITDINGIIQNQTYKIIMKGGKFTAKPIEIER